jgi:hypothetical protein
MIARAVARGDRREAVRAQPHPVESPVAPGGGRALNPPSTHWALNFVKLIDPGLLD